MSKRLLATSVCAALFLSLVSVATAQDATPEPMITEGIEEEISMDQVPNWVRSAANEAAEYYFPGATFESVQFDVGGELSAFEFAGTSAEGATIEIDILPDGSLQEVEEIIDESGVPAEALTTLQTYVADFTVADYERSIRPQSNGIVQVWYEFGGTNAAGEEFDVEVNEAGTLLLIELAG